MSTLRVGSASKEKEGKCKPYDLKVANTDATVVLQLFWILSWTTSVNWYQKGKTRKVKLIWIYWSNR